MWDKFNNSKLNLLQTDTINIYSIFLYLSIINIIYIYININCIDSFFWLNLKLSNFNLKLIILINLLLLYSVYTIYELIKTSNKYKMEFIVALCSISLISPLLFLSNNLISFYFIIELIVLTVFYQFINNKNDFKKKFSINNLYSIFSKSYVNLIFYNYWVSFFSSVFILYVLILILAITGLNDFFALNYMFTFMLNYNTLNNTLLLYILIFILFFAFILKLGISPLQLYKVEIYKSISLLNILYYTIIYFLFFFVFFILLFIYYLSSLHTITAIILLFFVIISSLYLFSFIYDINMIKVFFSYSTIINSLLFIILLMYSII